MSYRCPKCGGTDYYMQKVQVGSRAYDFNPTDSLNVTNDLIPNSMQVPGQVFINPVMEDVAFCKTCPTPVQMNYIKPPKDPMASGAGLGLFLSLFGVPGIPIYLAKKALTEIADSPTKLGGKKMAILTIMHNCIVIFGWIAILASGGF